MDIYGPYMNMYGDETQEELELKGSVVIIVLRVVGVTRMIEPKIGRKILKDWIIK